MIPRTIIIAVIFTVLGVGCTHTDEIEAFDVRQFLLESARQNAPDFPDEKSVQLTHFSHVGEVITEAGEKILVADKRAVLKGMLSPRGQNSIMFFDDDFRYLGKIGYVSSRPLWCDGGKLYLFGELDGFASGFSGNVIDLTLGFENLTVYRESAYGSSGGIDD